MPAQGISMRKLTQLVRLHIEAKLSAYSCEREHRFLPDREHP